MVCPKCKTKTQVIDSRNRGKQVIYRRRVCLNCGHKFSTWESPIPIDPRKAEAAKVSKAARTVKIQGQRIIELAESLILEQD